MKDDDTLITEYLDGDGKALEELAARHLASVYRLALWLTNNQEAAEDIAQESFVKTWTHVRTYRLGSDFEAWLFGITRYTAIDWLRKRKDVPLSAFETEEGTNMLLETRGDTSASAEELLARAQDESFVTALIEKLDPKYRRVIKLRYHDDLTFKEIGRMLGKPLHTVKSQYRRGLALLRKFAGDTGF